MANAQGRYEGATVGGRYRLGKLLGEGGMGAVYRAEALDRPGQPVALKLLHDEMAASPNVVERFLAEGDVCRRLDHPGVLRVLDVGHQNGVPYLVMELLEGRALIDYTEAGQRLPLNFAVTVCAGVLHALEYAHHNHVIHRDQARERVPRARRPGRVPHQAARFRHRALHRRGRRGEAAHGDGRPPRHAWLHEPRAGEGGAQRRSPRRSLGGRRDVLRDGDGPARVPLGRRGPEQHLGSDLGGPHQGPGAPRRLRQAPRALRRLHPPRAREGPGQAVRLRQGDERRPAAHRARRGADRHTGEPLDRGHGCRGRRGDGGHGGHGGHGCRASPRCLHARAASGADPLARRAAGDPRAPAAGRGGELHRSHGARSWIATLERDRSGPGPRGHRPDAAPATSPPAIWLGPSGTDRDRLRAARLVARRRPLAFGRAAAIGRAHLTQRVRTARAARTGRPFAADPAPGQRTRRRGQRLGTAALDHPRRHPDRRARGRDRLAEPLGMARHSPVPERPPVEAAAVHCARLRLAPFTC
ncbi:MAG: serine/threonine protein kinase [Myxococcales bacterium]|nr:serine/threonine protein kinase [Myxococcales bacterium]